jgi:hypothetical protein
MGVGGVRMVGSLGQGEAEVTLSVRSGFGNLALRRMPLGPQERGAPAAGFADPGAAGSAAARPEHQPAPAATGADDSAAGAAPAAAPVDPPASDDPASRRDLLLALLEAVARGELTPDEAAPYVARYLD